jgi:hypothetical protein
MRDRLLRAGLMLAVLLAAPAELLSQAGQPSQTLLISGQPGQAPVFQANGRSYVEIEALARLANGSLKFNGNQITLTLPAFTAETTATTPSVSPATHQGFSKEFMKAGIEEMSVIREWRSALVSAVQNGYPLTNDVVTGFRGQALTSLRLTSVAASTDADRNAYQLLSNVLDNVQKLSDKLLAGRKNMNYISPDALKDDPVNQQILTCTRSLASMAASGQFQDDDSCH